jgi:HPt (histidine-containing phosphotransfer) domain-containing protein
MNNSSNEMLVLEFQQIVAKAGLKIKQNTEMAEYLGLLTTFLCSKLADLEERATQTDTSIINFDLELKKIAASCGSERISKIEGRMDKLQNDCSGFVSDQTHKKIGMQLMFSELQEKVIALEMAANKKRRLFKLW